MKVNEKPNSVFFSRKSKPERATEQSVLASLMPTITRFGFGVKEKDKK